jgi:hypothetical protein
LASILAVKVAPLLCNLLDNAIALRIIATLSIPKVISHEYLEGSVTENLAIYLSRKMGLLFQTNILYKPGLLNDINN